MAEEQEILSSVYIDPTEKENLSAFSVVNRYVQIDAGLKQTGSFVRSFVCCFFLGLLFAYIAKRMQLEREVFYVIFAVVVAIVYGMEYWIYQRRFVSRIAAAAASSCQILLMETGIDIAAGKEQGFIPWESIRAMENRQDALVLVLRSYSVLTLPHRCFADQAQIDYFFDTIQSAAGIIPEQQRLPVGEIVTDYSFSVTLRSLLSNLWAGLLLALFLRKGAAFLRASVPQFILLLFAG